MSFYVFRVGKTLPADSVTYLIQKLIVLFAISHYNKTTGQKGKEIDVCMGQCIALTSKDYHVATKILRSKKIFAML